MFSVGVTSDVVEEAKATKLWYENDRLIYLTFRNVLNNLITRTHTWSNACQHTHKMCLPVFVVVVVLLLLVVTVVTVGWLWSALTGDCELS